MSRIKIEMPVEFSFSTSLQVRITDLNYGGHVGNDSFLSLVHEARQQFLNQLGYGELSIEGFGLIMSDAAIEFKAELNHRDEVTIFVTASNFTRIGFDLFYLLEVSRPGGAITAARVKTGMLCYDYPAGRVVSLPAAARQKLGG